MKRRTFIRSALATAATLSLPGGQLLADAHNNSEGKAADASASINAVTGDGGTTVIEGAVLKELEDRLYGHLLLPSSAGYDDARKVWNGMIDKRPALIVQCAGASDVASAVDLAREYQLLTAVRGGGHSAAGKSVCEGGIVIDCSRMLGVHVDPFSRTARVEPGVLLGELDHEAQRYGMATPSGVVSHTGAAGLTLGGGFGKLSRTMGLTIDSVLSFDLVTPSGEFKRVSAEENPDLFWGLRGGGGNFGVVTSFEYRLHEIGTDFLAGSVMHPLANARDVLEFYAELIETAPNELQVSATSVVFPNSNNGFSSLSFFYAGDPADGEKAIQPILDFGEPMNASVGVKKYIDIQKQIDRNVPPGQQYYQKSAFVDALEPGMIDAIIDMIGNPKPFNRTVNFTQVGGAISDTPVEATAYPNRAAKAQIVMGSSWPKPVDEGVEWIAMQRQAWDKIYPYTNGFYINNMTGDEGQKNIRSNFGVNYDRLLALKNEYDPTNLFRLNANVPPTI